jgi:hypothetical protein
MKSPSREFWYWIAAVAMLLVAALLVFWGGGPPDSNSDQAEVQISDRKSGRDLGNEAALQSPRGTMRPGDPSRNVPGNQAIEDLEKRSVSLMSSDGGLTSSAVQSMSLTPEEAKGVQNSLDKLLTDFSGIFASRANVVDRETNLEAGVATYRLPALVDRGESVLNGFRADVSKIVGARRAGDVFDLLISGNSTMKRFGGFGKYDVKIKFSPNPEEGGMDIVEYTYTNPDSGDRILKGTTTQEQFREMYGDTFVFDQKKDE